MIGELYEHALAGWMRPEVEHADGSRMPLPVEGWLHESPGDKSLLDRCVGPTLDIGSGPGRLTVALSERGIPALGIDITPYAVDLARSSGALVMLRDVFGRVPGIGRLHVRLGREIALDSVIEFLVGDRLLLGERDVAVYVELGFALIRLGLCALRLRLQELTVGLRKQSLSL